MPLSVTIPDDEIVSGNLCILEDWLGFSKHQYLKADSTELPAVLGGFMKMNFFLWLTSNYRTLCEIKIGLKQNGRIFQNEVLARPITEPSEIAHMNSFGRRFSF